MRFLVPLALAGLLAHAATAQLHPGTVTSPGQTAPHLQSTAQILDEVAWRFGRGAADAPPPTHVFTDEHCLRPLLTRIRDSVGAFTSAQLDWLLSVDQHVALAVENGLRRGGMLESTSGLPDYPGLTESLVGKDCVVHYSLTGGDASPDVGYAKAVLKEVDAALKKMSAAMKRPYYEPDRDGTDKLHVFLADLSIDPDIGDSLGFVQGVSSVPGSKNDKAETVYMVIDTGLREYADTVKSSWKKVVKSTAYHETMHCVQSAYNSFMSSWATEGQATWAELGYGKVSDSLVLYLEHPESIFRKPGLPLWEDTIHKYSTAPMFAYLEFRMGKGANTTYLELSPETNDGLSILESVLIQDFIFFEEFYGPYLARLYTKDIKGIKKSKMPDLAVRDMVNSYGFETADAVKKTGVHVYQLNVPAGLKTDLLYAKVSNVPEEGTAEGNEFRPVGVLVHQKNKRLSLAGNFWDVVDGFKKKAGAALLVTDMEVDFQTDTPTPYMAEVFAPHIVVKKVDVDSPIAMNQTATITFTYDLLGVPDEPTFPVILFRGIKGPRLKVEQNLFMNWVPGVGMEQEIQFTPPFNETGGYSFRFTAKTPPDSFGGGHMKSKTKAKIKVVKG